MSLLAGAWWSPAPTDLCVTSAGDGSFVLPGAGADQATTLWFERDGFLPSLRAIQTTASDIALPTAGFGMFPEAVPAVLMGARLDPTKGHIAFQVGTAGKGPPPTVAVTATAVDGSTVSPVYLDSSGAPVPGAAGGTRGGFLNLEPGLYVVRFEGAQTGCSADGLSGYPAPASSPGVIAPVVAGIVTAPVAVTCPE